MSHDSETPRPEGETVRDTKSKMLTGAGESDSESESGREREREIERCCCA